MGEQVGGVESNMTPRDNLLKMLDYVELEVEKLRKEAMQMEDKKDTLMSMLDALSNSELLAMLTAADLDDIQGYINRLTLMCMTVEILVRTERDQAQEESLDQVNKMINDLVTLAKGDPGKGREKCAAFLAACSTHPAAPVDKSFEMALLGCALDDQKKIKKRLEGLLDYLIKDTVSPENK